MRPCLVTAAFTLTLVACGSRMQQLESASQKIKECVNQCSLAVSPVNDNKANAPVMVVNGTESGADQTQSPAGGDRIQTIWNSRLNLW